jgi:hypothetical protein
VNRFDHREQPVRPTTNWPSHKLSHHWKKGSSIEVPTVAAGRRSRKPVDDRGLRLDVAVEPVIGNEAAGDDDAGPEDQREEAGARAARPA